MYPVMQHTRIGRLGGRLLRFMVYLILVAAVIVGAAWYVRSQYPAAGHQIDQVWAWIHVHGWKETFGVVGLVLLGLWLFDVLEDDNRRSGS